MSAAALRRAEAERRRAEIDCMLDTMAARGEIDADMQGRLREAMLLDAASRDEAAPLQRKKFAALRDRLAPLAEQAKECPDFVNIAATMLASTLASNRFQPNGAQVLTLALRRAELAVDRLSLAITIVKQPAQYLAELEPFYVKHPAAREAPEVLIAGLPMLTMSLAAEVISAAGGLDMAVTVALRESGRKAPGRKDSREHINALANENRVSNEAANAVAEKLGIRNDSLRRRLRRVRAARTT